MWSEHVEEGHAPTRRSARIGEEGHARGRGQRRGEAGGGKTGLGWGVLLSFDFLGLMLGSYRTKFEYRFDLRGKTVIK